jgi:predicted DsbA family dithiol-disulfide isomerase
VDILSVRRRLKSLMDQEGLPFGEDMSMTYNTRLSQELAKWADSRPEGSRLHDVLFKAYFVHGMNIGEADVLLGLAEQAGLPVSDARCILESREMSEAVDEDWKRSRDLSVTAVPTFLTNSFRIVGAQSYEVLSSHLENSGVSHRRDGVSLDPSPS